MNKNRLKLISLGIFTVLFSLTTKTVSAVNGVSCKVHSYLVNENYSLPYKNDGIEMVNGSSNVKPGDYVLYMFEIGNQTGVERIELQKTYMSQLLGKNEPIDIVQIRPQNGQCTVNDNDKSVFCNTKYSFAESAHFPIEYLVKINPQAGNSIKTSSKFSIETDKGSAECASYLWIKDENKDNPIVWSTPYAVLESRNFYIEVAGKKFYGKEPIRISSDPGVDKTTLEAIWMENGVEMRMFMYFQKTDKGEWNMYELRSYNGQERGEWVYYVDSLGNDVKSVPGYHNYYDERVFVAKDGSNAKIYCDNCFINAFFNKQLPKSETGYILDFGLPQGNTVTVSDNPMTGYGLNALLKTNDGDIVDNQTGFDYSWKTSHPELVYLTVGNLDYGNGTCAYNILPPCPQNHIDISGLKAGKATVSLSVIRGYDQKVLAENSFEVVVNTAPILKIQDCVERGGTVTDFKTDVCCPDLVFVEPQGDRNDILGLCVQECQDDSQCFDRESCQKGTDENKGACYPVVAADGKDIQELKNEVGQLKEQIETQKLEQNKLRQMIESIWDFIQKIFG